MFYFLIFSCFICIILSFLFLSTACVLVFISVFVCVFCVHSFHFLFYILLACLNIAGWGLLFIVLDCFLISLYGLYLDVFSRFWQCCRERDLKIKQKRTFSFSVILFFSFYFSQKFTTFFVCLLLFSVTALKSLGVCMFIFSFFLVFCVCLDILSFVLLYTY